MYLEQAKALFEAAQLARNGEVQPSSESELHLLEQKTGARLPEAYREFLRWMGHGAGNFLQGTDVFYQQLDGLNSAAQELLLENGIADELPEDAFVFYMHQGYQFMFFRLLEGDDPPIYFFGEGTGQEHLTQLYQHFSDFLKQEIEGHARLIQRFRTAKGQ